MQIVNPALSRFGTDFVSFGCFLVDFGDLLGTSGVSLGVSWGPLGSSGTVLEAYLGRSGQRRPPKFPKERHRCSPKVAKGAQEAARWPPKVRQETINEALKAIRMT